MLLMDQKQVFNGVEYYMGAIQSKAALFNPTPRDILGVVRDFSSFRLSRQSNVTDTVSVCQPAFLCMVANFKRGETARDADNVVNATFSFRPKSCRE